MERKFGVILTVGYLTFTLDTQESGIVEALDQASDFVMNSHTEI